MSLSIQVPTNDTSDAIEKVSSRNLMMLVGALPKIKKGIQKPNRNVAKAIGGIVRPMRWRHLLREALKSPVVIFALAVAVIGAVGAPLFALGDVIQ